MASPTFKGALKDDFGEAVVACEMPEPCKFSFLDSCQKRGSCGPTRELILLRIQSLVLCSSRSFLMHLVSKSLDPFFFRVSKHGLCLTAVEVDGGDKRLVELELAGKAEGIVPPDPV